MDNFYAYYVDDNGVMTIYADGKTVADISDCGHMNKEECINLMNEVLFEQGYKV